MVTELLFKPILISINFTVIFAHPFNRVKMQFVMEPELASLTSDELVALYQKTNTELTRNLLNGSPWQEQQQSINLLTEISKTLTKRKVDFNLDAQRVESMK